MGISPKKVRTQFWDARQFCWKWADTAQMLHIVSRLQMLQMALIDSNENQIYGIYENLSKSQKIYEDLRKSTEIHEDL